MRKRYRVTVYAKRGDQPTYSYVAFPTVKPAKVARLVADTAAQVLGHETKGAFKGTIIPKGTGMVIRVGICKFIVKAG
jgi:hypothetical protein